MGWILATAVAASALAWGVAQAQPSDPQTGAAGDGFHTLLVGDRTRRYLLHSPSEHPVDRPLPLVLVFHGGYQRAQAVARRTGFSELADREGFMVAYPVGVERHWNDGRGTVNPGVDDMAFIEALLKDIGTRHHLDRRRVYAAGASNGGFLVQRLACERSDRIAAFATVIATLAEPLRVRCRPSRPVPLLMINATRDPIVPWAGGEIKGRGGRVLAVAETVRFWAGQNRCPSDPDTRSLADRDPGDGVRVVRTRYGVCEGGVEVVLMRLLGAGHTWPGGRGRQLPLLLGKTGRDIDATEEIWRFLRRYRLP